jgi:serine/threonine-protein kinase
VPDEKGEDQDSATKELEGKGFKVDVKMVESQQDEGTVVDQNPAGGSQAQKGATITLKVAKTAQVQVPPVIGQQLDAARQALESKGFVVEVEQVDNEQPANTVVNQTPSGNEPAAAGSHVKLQVSKGPAKPQVAVPNIAAGTKLGDAINALNGAGLKPAVANGAPNDPNTSLVQSTDPPAGTMVDQGSTVTITTVGPPSGQNNGGNGGLPGGFFGGNH